MPQPAMTRRRFLHAAGKTTLAGACAGLLPHALLAAEELKPPPLMCRYL